MRLFAYSAFLGLVLPGCASARADPQINSGAHIAVPAEQTTQPAFSETEKGFVRMVLVDLLYADETQGSLDFYAPGTRTILLKSFGAPIEWPRDFNPSIPGWRVLKDPHAIREKTALGIDIRYFGPPREVDRIHAPEGKIVIQVALYSAISIGTIGAADVTYLIDIRQMMVRFVQLEDA